jgi:DNA-binding NtrC family response regulator
MVDMDLGGLLDEATEDGPAPAASLPRLLFVDDERAILTALRVVFRSGYDVSVTTDGRQAVQWLKEGHFDVIVSDQRMPIMTGVEVLKQAQQYSPKTIRVLLTGYSDTEAIIDAINEVEVHRFLQTSG